MSNREASERAVQYTAIRIWRALRPEERLKAAAAIWEPGFAKPEEVAGALAAIANARRSRIQSIREAPKAKRAGYLAGMVVLPDGVAAALLYAYHMAHKIPMMRRFLELLEIEHEEGKITSEIDPPGEEKLASCVDLLLAEFDGSEVAIYLQTLFNQDPETWAGLEAVIESRKLG